MQRYRPLLITTGVIYLVAAPVFYFIDAGAGLPLWWRIYDCTWCIVVGVAAVELCRRPLSERPIPELSSRRRLNEIE